MHSLRRHFLITSLLCVSALACSKSDSSDKEEAAKIPTAEQGTPEAKPEKKPETKPDEKPDEKPVAVKPDDDRASPENMEGTINASDTVKEIDHKGKLPKDGLWDNDDLHGKFHSVKGWQDQYGEHMAVTSISRSEKGDEISSMVTVEIFNLEGDSWTSQRAFKGSVDKCQFDVEMTPKTGPWSITDLDNDGLGEFTFSWSLGCRSDVSPVTHKVILAAYQKGTVEKYVLRGTTGIKVAGEVEGGDFIADKAFDTKPDIFLEHASKVWEKTSIEKMD